MLSPLKKNYYLPLIILFFIAPNSIRACQKTNSLTSANSIKVNDTLVSEFHQYLVSETDLAWQKKFVTITYKGLVDKFAIRILYIPREEAPLGHISGPGIMEFTDPSKSTRFTIKCMDLAISMDRIGIDSEEQRQIPLDKSFELQFDWTSNKDGLNGNITEPFFFYDVDFDGKVELVVTQYSNGVQNSNTYKAYELNASGLVSDSKQITNDEPFSLFNDFTEFKKMERTITIGNFFGGGNTQTSIYKKINPSEFKLISIVKCTFEEKITFELIDDEMVEVNRRKIINP